MPAVMAEGHSTLMPPLWRLKTPSMPLREQAAPEDTGDEVKGDQDSMELPTSRRAALERLVEAGERLKRTLTGPFLSAVKSFLQVLLEVLTGDAAEDFQKLQDSSLQSYWFSDDGYSARLSKEWRVTTAITEALKHPATSAHIQDAVKLLLEFKLELFHHHDRSTADLFGIRLQIISLKLQKAQNETKMKGSTKSLGWSLDEGECMKLASLLQKTIKSLEARENTSRKDVKEVAETDQTCCHVRPTDTNFVISLSSRRDSKKRLVEVREKLKGILEICKKYKEPKSENLDVLIPSTVKSYIQESIKLDEATMMVDNTTETVNESAMEVADTAMKGDDTAIRMDDTAMKVDEAHSKRWKCWNWNCLFFRITDDPGRAGKRAMTSTTPKLLGLLVLASLLGVGAAALVSVQSRGRAEVGKAYSLTCVVGGLPGTDTTSSYIWYKDGDIIREETKQVLTFTRLTQGDDGMYQCGPKRPSRLRFLLSQPRQLRVLDASADQDIIYCPLDLAPADFSWTIPAHAMYSVVVVVSPRGEELFTWTRDLPPLDEFTFWDRAENVQVEGANIRFSLSEVWPEDDGHYSCREGSITGPVIPDCGQTLHYVTIPQPGAPKSELTLEGQLGVLVCPGQFPRHYFHLGLNFFYEWLKDGQLIPEQRGSRLVFYPAQQLDFGLYSCRVRESTRNCIVSPDSKGNWLQVSVPPRVKLHGQDKDSILKVPEGRRLILTCEVEAAFPPVPPRGFSWTFSPSDSSPAKQLQETGDTLVLGPLTRQDSGQYTCQARNDQNFRGGIPPGHDSITVAVLYLEEIRLTPADVKVKEGESFTLTCKVESSPTAHLQWTVDGAPHREIIGNVNFYKVTTATTNDTGNYTCHATNSDKLQRSAWTTVTVIGKNIGVRDELNNETDGEGSQKGGDNCVSSSSLLVLLPTVPVLLLQ